MKILVAIPFRVSAMVFAGILALAWGAAAHTQEVAASVPKTAGLGDVAEFEEHLGGMIPADLTFFDEAGQEVTLGDILDKPTILSMVYYDCPGICTPLLNEEADVLGKCNLDPAKQPFQLLTVSFSPKDDFKMAAEKRKNYLKVVGRDDLPPDTWRFFTGTQENIDRLTEAVGFRYKRAGKEFTHPGGLVMVAPGGKIVRYLYGIQYLPFDFEMGVYEAAKGSVQPTTARLLNFCFSYDPSARTYVFNLAKVIGSVMLISIAIFIIFLVFSTRGLRGRKGRAHGRT